MSFKNPRSPLYFITGDSGTFGLSTVEMVRAVVRGGAGIVQYREKSKTTRELVEEATELIQITRPSGVPLIINDRADVALAVTADGLHVGAEDLAVATARRLMGPEAIIGATVYELDDVQEAVRQGADYVAIGPIFPSPTKPDADVVGIGGLAAVARQSQVPVCAIGGITIDNLALLQESRPDMVAVISAIAAAKDPQAVTRQFVNALKKLYATV